MNDFEAAVDALALSAAHSIMRVRFEPLRLREPIARNLSDAITAITYDPEYAKLLQYHLDRHPRTGISASPVYGFSEREQRTRLGVVYRRLSGIPYDSVWWTGDPSNLLSY